MQRDYVRWHSPSLGRDMEMLVYGHSGAPVLVYPTSMGRFYENEDMGMIGALADKIENGFIQVFCVDSVDAESWYNWGGDPRWRIGRHLAYDYYCAEEVVPFIRSRNSNGYLIVHGCSFGATHAVIFGLRHPEKVHKIVALSGRYRLSHYLGGYHDENIYYCSPMDFIGGLQDGDYKEKLRVQKINLLTGTWDLPMCQSETRDLHDLLDWRGIPNTYEVWENSGHDWPYWFKQARNFI